MSDDDVQRRDAIRDVARFQRSLQQGHGAILNPGPGLHTTMGHIAAADSVASKALIDFKRRPTPSPELLYRTRAAAAQGPRISRLKDSLDMTVLDRQVRLHLWLTNPSFPTLPDTKLRLYRWLTSPWLRQGREGTRVGRRIHQEFDTALCSRKPPLLGSRAHLTSWLTG